MRSKKVATQEQLIVDAISKAVAEHRLRPGTKLRQQALAEVFHCNRAFVKGALLTLAANKIVDLQPNRGAYVATPSATDAKDIFQARRAIERTIVKNVIHAASKHDLKRLDDHCAEESNVLLSGNRHEALRKSGEFHLILGEGGHNRVLAEILQELILRTSLILGLYAPHGSPICKSEDHQRILDAIKQKDERHAVELLDMHLRDIENSVQFETYDETEDLRQILVV